MRAIPLLQQLFKVKKVKKDDRAENQQRKIKGEGLLTLHLYYGKYHPLDNCCFRNSSLIYER